MADDNLTLRMRAIGARATAREVQGVGRAVDQSGRAARRSSGHIRLFANGLRPVASIATGAATALGVLGLAGAFKTVIGTASDVNESLTKNRVLFGKFSKSVERFSGRSAESFGIAKTSALEYTGVFGNLFRALGVTQKHSAKMSVRLTRLAADMASFNNTSIDDALEAIRAGVVGETEPLRRFGVNLNDATLRTKAMAMGLTKTTKNVLTPYQRSMAAQALIIEQTKLAHGDFHRTAGGLANQMRILKARFVDLTGNIGTKLLPYVVKGVNWFNKFWKQIENNVGAGGKLRRVVERLARQIVDLFNAGKDAVTWIVKMVNQFKAGKPLAVGLGIGVAALAGALTAYRLATLAATIQQWLLNAAMIANPVGLIVAGLVALGAALVVAYLKIKPFRDVVNEVFGFVKRHWRWLVLPVAAIAVPIVAIIQHFQGIKSTVLSVYNFVRDKFDWLIAFIAGLPGRVRTAARGMWDGITHPFVNAYNWIKGMIDKIIGAVGRMKSALDSVNPVKQVGKGGGIVGGALKSAGRSIGIPGLASGGPVLDSGPKIVGERGPELVTLPRGSYVHSNADSQAMLGGDVVVPITLTMDGQVVAQVVHRQARMKKAVR